MCIIRYDYLLHNASQKKIDGVFFLIMIMPDR